MLFHEKSLVHSLFHTVLFLETIVVLSREQKCLFVHFCLSFFETESHCVVHADFELCSPGQPFIYGDLLPQPPKGEDYRCASLQQKCFRQLLFSHTKLLLLKMCIKGD